MVGEGTSLMSRDAVVSEEADAVESEDAVDSDILTVGGELKSREASHKRLRKISDTLGSRHQPPAISRGRDWPAVTSRHACLEIFRDSLTRACKAP